jgi:hypothetical protein
MLHEDPCLGGLLDVAPPQLVHACEQLLRCAALDRQLEDESWLAGREAFVVLRRPPSHLAQLVTSTGRLVIDVVRDRLAKPGHPFVGDGGLDRFGTPAPGDCGCPDSYAEGPRRAYVIRQRPQPLRNIRCCPVDHWAFRQVGEILLDLGQLPVQHQPGANRIVAALNQPTDSPRHSLLTLAHAGVWRKLTEGWLALNSRCRSASMVRTEKPQGRM